MTTPEQGAWDTLRPILAGAGLDPRRVENVVGPGHPDIDYAGGNIELKALDHLPKFVQTKVNIKTFTGEQAGWMAQRWSAGGRAWLLVRVGQRHGGSWYLFDGWTALNEVYRGATSIDWFQLAALYVPSGVRWGAAPAGEGRHCWRRQLHDWLAFDLDRLMPWSRARAMRLDVRQTLAETAAELGWDVGRLFATEHGNGTQSDVTALLGHWEA